MQNSLRYLLILIAFSTLACGGVDITFVNQVKIFEPKWIDLSEKFSFVQRNLDLTQKRYEQDLNQVEALFSEARGETRVELMNSRNRYREMMAERDDIQEAYETKSKEFSDLVYEFNEWENRLMKGKWKEDEARAAFIQYKAQYDELDKQVRALQTDLLKNIETHNSILQSMTKRLEIFTNYDIQAK